MHRAAHGIHRHVLIGLLGKRDRNEAEEEYRQAEEEAKDPGRYTGGE